MFGVAKDTEHVLAAELYQFVGRQTTVAGFDQTKGQSERDDGIGEKPSAGTCTSQNKGNGRVKNK